MKIDWNKVKEGLTIMDVLKEENKELKEEIERLNKALLDIKEYIKEVAYWEEETEEGYHISGKILHDDDVTEIEDIVNKALGSEKE